MTVLNNHRSAKDNLPVISVNTEDGIEALKSFLSPIDQQNKHYITK